MQRFNPNDIEQKWQKIWDESGTYTADLQSDKPKYIAMSMFNYPSGAGIHIGHAMNYTISDVKARFKRQQGFESYHPIGWDAFGLPAENYAIKAGVSPQESMATIIPSYHKQYKAMGWSNDWEKEIATHLPEYYKWTQWIFSQMHKHGLAYQASRMQWWCDIDKTVLANEQIIDGKCWRHDGPDDPLVQKKEVKQWFFKITEYADELLEATDALDWTESVKLAQKNWIGKSTGAEVEFIVGKQDYEIKDSFKLVPELTKLVQDGKKWVTYRLKPKNLQVGDYAKLLNNISEKNKPAFAIAKIKNISASKLKDIPLNSPGHEAFASEEEKLKAYQGYYGDSVSPETEFTIYEFEVVAPIITVFTTAHDTIYGVTFMVLAPEHELAAQLTTPEQKKAVEEYVTKTQTKSEVDRQANKDKTGVFTGSYSINPVNGKEIPVWVADYVLAGYGTGAIMAVPGEDERDHEFAEKFDLDIIYTTEQQEFVGYADIKAAPQKFKLANSAEFDGQNFAEGRKNIMQKLIELGAATESTNYKMRDWSVGRQRYWGAPIPIIHCPKCGPVLVPDEDLPVVLPELDDFQPSGDGRSALARAKDWLVVDCPQCGGPGERETDTLDTYICSSWYMFRYFDPHNQHAIFDSDIVNKWAPIDFYNGGDHATAHLLYARFIARFFSKIGLINNSEPFKQMLYNGKVTAQDGTMFSKSKGTGIDPLEIIAQGYGADALRTYLMFAAPLELTSKWDPQGVPGAHRFLSRVWNLVQEYLVLEPGHSEHGEESQSQNNANEKAVLAATHFMIKKVTGDLEQNHYNTAIAAAMACTNELYKLKTIAFGKNDTWQEALEGLVACIAPFAPHTSEELWHQLGHSSTVHKDSWPKFNDKYLVSDEITIAVQVNGKLRGEVVVAADNAEADITAKAQELDKVVTHLDGKPIKKTIYVPGKLVNFVV